ncbi:MAG: ATP-binding protein [Myxococcota bacterium]
MESQGAIAAPVAEGSATEGGGSLAGRVPPEPTGLPKVFWIGLLGVLVFGVFCAWITGAVSQDRDAVSLRVGWLIATQGLEERARGLAALPPGELARTWAELGTGVETIAGEAASEAPALAARLTKLRATLAATPSAAGAGEVLSGSTVSSRRCGAITPSSRSGSAGRWSMLNVLVAVSLALALLTLGLVVVVDRRRRHVERWRRALSEAVVEIDRARRAALAADQSKSRFLANVSHEIRTPMSGVIGMADILSQDALTPEQRDKVAIIRSSSEALLRIVGDILDLAKIESGHLAIETQTFEPAALVEAVVASFGPLAKAHGLELAVVTDPSVPRRVSGDATRVRQILGNLVTNALKFTERGSVTVRVVDLGRDALGRSVVRFDVEDTGPGIASGEAEGLFRAFARLPTRGVDPGGTGLGLTISEELVERMGGSIGMTSEVGRGTTFHVTLAFAPAKEAVEPEPAPVALPAPTSAATPDRPADGVGSDARTAASGSPSEGGPARARRVLVAEDNPVNRMIISTMLTKLGMPHDLVEDGQQAVERTLTGEYGAVFLDCAMPVLDGFDAARTIRARENGARRTPLIALTAYAMDMDRARCFEAGMDDHLAKPLTVKDLAAALARWLPPA